MKDFVILAAFMSTSLSSAIVPTPKPRRPAGLVIAASVLALVGCLILLFGAIALASAFFLRNSPQTAQLSQYPAIRAMEFINGVVILLMGGLCIWTAVDLLRVKRWARISILVLGGMMTFFSLIDAAIFSLIAFHPLTLPQESAQVSPELVKGLFMVLAGFCFVFVLIGVWWLVYFNLKRVRAVFAAGGAMPEGAHAEPATLESGAVGVLVSCLAVLYLLGAAGTVLAAILHFPLLLFSHVFRGNAASLVLLFFAAVSIWMGIGLLRRIKAAWAVALLFNAFGLFSEIWYLLPGSRMMQLQHEVLGSMAGHGFPVEPNPMMEPMVKVGMIGGIVMIVAVFWLLLRAKPLFEAKG